MSEAPAIDVVIVTTKARIMSSQQRCAEDEPRPGAGRCLDAQRAADVARAISRVPAITRTTDAPIVSSLGTEPWTQPWWKPADGDRATFFYVILIHLLAAVGLIFFATPGWRVIAVTVATAWAGALGVTVCYHRSLSHTAVRLHPVVRHVLIFFAMFGTFFLVSQYFQLVLGYTALESGLFQLPMAVVMITISPQVPRLVARFGVARVVPLGPAIRVVLPCLTMSVGSGATTSRTTSTTDSPSRPA